MTTTTEPVEMFHGPTTVYYAAGIAYPLPVAEAIADYEAAHAAHTAQYADLLAAVAAVPVSEAEDAAALTTTARAGEEVDPGGRADRARREVEAQAVRTGAARERATAATDRLRGALDVHGDALVAPVLAAIRAAADDYSAALERARRDVDTAGRRVQDTGAAVRMLAPVFRRRGAHTLPDLAAAPDGPTWRADVTASLLATVDRLERLLTPADTTA